MDSVFKFASLKRSLWLVVAVFALSGMGRLTHADTIVSIDFDDPTDLEGLFNPDSNPYLFVQDTAGLARTGGVNSSAVPTSGDVWTSKIGYSVVGAGDSYRLSSFFRTTDGSGHSGIGIATSNVNNPKGSGNTSSGIGYIATDKVVTILSSEQGRAIDQTFQFNLSEFDWLFEFSWYHFEVTILTQEANTFDVTVTISNATADGTIGTVVSVFTQTGIVNNDVGNANTIHPYFSINPLSGTRFDRVDDLTMRLSGNATVVPDPEADTDNDGELDTVDEDDDGDGANDDTDTFPLDETEVSDFDGDGIGDREDTDDDGDGFLDNVDPTPLGGTLPDNDNDDFADINDPDDDNDGTPDTDDAFPFDETEQLDTDTDGEGNNADLDDDNDGTPDTADAFPLDATEQIDTDIDGQGNNADEDDDNDGTPDTEDDLPLDANEQVDTDGDLTGNNADLDDDNDGTPDSRDAFPLDPTEQIDTDMDGRGNNIDTDDDNDGALDINDDLPLDPTEQLDTDRDGLGNNIDTDDDADGIPDEDDDFPLDPHASTDTDNDGIPNFTDDDDDGDGTPDAQDAFPLDETEHLDTDGDRQGNNADDDDDNDGTPDSTDAFPLDATEQVDTDRDLTGNNSDEDDDNDGTPDLTDAFPLDANEQLDTDNNGVGNNADLDDDGDGTPDAIDALPLDPREQLDTDRDGIGNNADLDDDGDNSPDIEDKFPLDPTEWLDSDNDRIGNNADPTPFGDVDERESDRDSDGVVDRLDPFPDDASEWFDSDGDGVGNNTDAFDLDPLETLDSDGDGVGDRSDAFPDNATEQTDIDGDLIGDNIDDDNDNDGVIDTNDAFPLDPNEQLDTDLDGIGNNADTDDDNDGVSDQADAFPLLATESIDSDNDGTGDNADTDDDNDGSFDLTDAFPFDRTESIDTDNDGTGNNQDTDDDNDGYSDAIELQYESDALDAGALPQDLDVDRDTLADNIERGNDADGDGIGNEFDIDSDNDGIFDLIEASANPAEAALLDADNDGSLDSTELRGLTRVTRPMDTDGDGILDYRDLDSDNDGISDAAEVTSISENFVSINNLQSDASSAVLADPDGDSLVNYRDLDSDNDGIPDLVEAGGVDADANGIADDFLDSNADGIDDAYFAVPLVLPDTDADGTQDHLDLDSDGDGIFDLVSTGLIDADLNSDGRLDISSDSNGNGIFDYADVAVTNGTDTDGDGIDDRVDASILNASDFDLDGIADRFDADVEGDGLVQIATIAYPEEPTPVVVEPPTVAPAEPEPEQPDVVATTGISGGGCSIAGSNDMDMTLTALLLFSCIYLTLVRVGTWRTLKSALLIFISTCLAAGPTLADVQTGLYLGMGGGASRLMPTVSNATLDDRDSVGNTWNTNAGYQLSRTLGVELEYTNLGTTVLEPVGAIDYQDINISGLYHFGGVASALGGKKYSLYGRFGVGKIQTQSNLRLDQGSDAHWLAGAGIQIPVSPKLSLRAEGINYDADVSRIGVSLVYQMGRPSLSALAPLAKRFGFGKDTDVDEESIAGVDQPSTGDEQTDQETAKLDQSSDDQPQNLAAAVKPVNNNPYVLSKNSHQPHQAPTPDIEKLMTIDPAPSETLRVGTKTLTISTVPAASNNDATTIEIAGATIVQPMSDNSASTSTLKLETPKIAAALPASESKPVPDAALEPVLFGFDSSSLSSLAKKSLQPLIDYLFDTPEAKVTLTGHTDSIGSSEYNQLLSVRRARAVEQFLLQQGIDRKMIRLLGMGEKRPIRPNDKPSGRKSNRRVDIVVD